jgi:hypothetical protein
LAINVHVLKLSKTKPASNASKKAVAGADKKLGGSTSAERVEGGINHVDRRRADGPACLGAFLYDALLIAQGG